MTTVLSRDAYVINNVNLSFSVHRDAISFISDQRKGEGDNVEPFLVIENKFLRLMLIKTLMGNWEVC